MSNSSVCRGVSLKNPVSFYLWTASISLSNLGMMSSSVRAWDFFDELPIKHFLLISVSRTPGATFVIVLKASNCWGDYCSFVFLLDLMDWLSWASWLVEYFTGDSYPCYSWTWSLLWIDFPLIPTLCNY